MSAPSPQSVSQTATLGISAARYAQLIYTSFDDGSGSGGGWQVKSETGDLTIAERQELTARIATRFDVGAPLPTYPTPDEIADRPARLAYATLDDNSAGYWHTVDAGKDATGRPGNVLAHVLLDRQIIASSALRPIQLWGSPQWLRPYGAAEVAAATLGSDALPEPSQHISAASVITFLTGTTVDRQSVFRVLLDAVYAALAGGPGVMLITGDLDRGPRWIAAISYFMSPGTARRFSWSTYDDPALAATDLSRGIHVVVVARERATEAPAGDWITIDELEEPGIGQLGSTHRTSTGAVTVTGWSVLAEGVLADESLATRLLAQQDTIAAELGDHDLTPAWPLALAVRREEELREFHRDADHVIAEEAPRHADSIEWIDTTVAAAVSATAPADTADAYDRFLRARLRRIGVASATQQLLRSILNDPEWLLSSTFAELPAEPIVELESLQTPIDTALQKVIEPLPSDSVHTLRAHLRVAELLIRLGRADAYLKRETETISALITADALTALSDTAAALTLLEDTAISESTREIVLRPAIARMPATVLDVIDVAVWRWVFADAAAAPIIPANPRSYDCGLLPRYIARVLDHPEKDAFTPESASRLAAEALFLALGADDLPDVECQELVNKLSMHARLSPSDLSDIFGRWPNRVRPAAAIYALYYEQLPEELLTTIADAPLPPCADRWDQYTVAAARLRSLNREPRPWPAERVEEALHECASTVLDSLPLEHIAEIAAELIEPLALLFTVGQARGVVWCDIERPVARELRRRLSGRAADVVDLLADMAQTQIVDIDWLVGHGLIHRIGTDLEAPTLFTNSTDDQRDWSEVVVSELIKRGVYDGPTDAASLRDSAWPRVRVLTAEQAEKFFAGYPQAAREWLQVNRIRTPERQRSGFRWPS